MKRILIRPIGNIDSDILKTISTSLVKIFHCMAETGPRMPLPMNSYDSWRAQYSSTTILSELQIARNKNFDRELGVTDIDLFVPGLNFVFGEADITAGTAIISLARLRQEFYGFRPDTRLLHERALKEAIHELGHTYGLSHCHDPQCIMYFSNSLKDTDGKGPGFCALCKRLPGSSS